MVDTCKSNNLFIVNGRFGKDKGMGAQTFRNKSVIDYTLCTAESFEILNEFEVVELDSIFSDGHALLSWSIACNLLMNKPTEITHNYTHNFQWSENSKDLFISNINMAEIIDLQERLEHAPTLNVEPNHHENIPIQEAHGPRVAHLSDIATADTQMLCNIFPILSSQLMKRSSFKQFFILKKIYGMPVN